MTKNCYCTYKNLGKITKSVEVDNTGLQGFVVGKREVISEVIFCVESESELRIGPSRQDFKIFEVMYSKNRVFFLLLRLCTGRTTFYWSSLQVASFSTTLTLQNQLSNDHQRFFFRKVTGILSFDIYPHNAMCIHINSLEHTILCSVISL